MKPNVKLEDNVDMSLKGYLEIIVNKNGIDKVVYENVVTLTAREIVRDFLYGDLMEIKLNIGDLGYTQTSDWNNPPPATGTEIHLVHKLAQVFPRNKTKLFYKGKHTVLYEFFMDKPEYNGLTDATKGITRIVEIGLAVNDERLFTKKNHPVITKDIYTTITYNYYLLF